MSSVANIVTANSLTRTFYNLCTNLSTAFVDSFERRCGLRRARLTCSGTSEKYFLEKLFMLGTRGYAVARRHRRARDCTC